MSKENQETRPEQLATNNAAVGRSRRGKIVSLAMDSVAIVDIERQKTHKLYGKSFKVNKRIKAKYSKDKLEIGDQVFIRERRPQSKDVHFEIIKVEK